MPVKKIIIFTLSALFLATGVLVALPFIFRDDILRLVEHQSARYLHGRLSIGKMSMNMFENFPNLNVTLSGITLTGAGGEHDTLLLAPRIEASVNLKSLVVGDAIIVRRLLLADARLAARVDADGKANWNILVAAGDGKDGKDGREETGGEISVRLDRVVIDRLAAEYRDVAGDLHAGAGALSVELDGIVGGKEARMNLHLRAREVFLHAGGVAWTDRGDIAWETTVTANPRDLSLDVKPGKLLVNGLALTLAGSVTASGDGYLLDLSAGTTGTRVEELLALVPANYRPFLDGVKASGDVRLQATVKGEYRGDHLPAVDLQCTVVEAGVAFPDLPVAIEKINLDLRVATPGGKLAAASVDVNRLSLVADGNPVEATLHVTNDGEPRLHGTINGALHLESLNNVFAGINAGGTILANLSVEGKREDVEKGEYGKINARGQLALEDVRFKNEQFPGGITVAAGKIAVAPTRLDFSGFQVKVNSSEALVDGQLDNYLPYLFNGKPLEGRFTLVASRLDLNELIDEDGDGKEIVPGDADGEIAGVPDNLSITLDARVDTLLFGDLVVKHLDGKARANKGIVALEDVNMEALGGKVILDGSYHAAVPRFDLRARAVAVDLDEAYNAFSIVREALPIAVHCRGKVSAATRLAARLDREMHPVMNTLDGEGTISVADVLINDNPALDQLAALLHNDEISRLRVSNLDIHFKVDKGNVSVAPFTTRLAGLPATIHGTQAVTGEINYTLSVNIDRARFGKDIEQLLAVVPGSGSIKSVDVAVNVGGTLDKPTFRIGKAVTGKAVIDQVKDNVQKEIIKGFDKLFKKK
jgi:hypothetical protein